MTADTLRLIIAAATPPALVINNRPEREPEVL
jgi:hypothetical protein